MGMCKRWLSTSREGIGERKVIANISSWGKRESHRRSWFGEMQVDSGIGPSLSVTRSVAVVINGDPTG